MMSRPVALRNTNHAETWQDEAWAFYDSNGELRFAVGWIANGLSQVNLIAARRPVLLGDDPAPMNGDSGIDGDAVNLVAAIAGGPDGQSQLLAQLARLLTVPGIGWVLIEADSGQGPEDANSWDWRVVSNEELRDDRGDYEVEDVESDASNPDGWRTLRPNHVLIKVWRSHPRRSSKPDSSCRGALRPLRQLAMLDDHIEATAQSRLAGAGMLILPNEIEFAPIAHADDPDDPDDESGVITDDFVEVLVDTMTTPIADRASAAAVVPLTVKVPGEYVDKVKHITFWSEFSDTVLGLGERAIKRLALALDMPPEVVTGVSGMNHWGAWRVQEEAITLHIEPLAEVICHALTKGYLRPGLLALGHSQADVDVILIHHDVTDLTVRPDLSDNTIAAWDRLQASDAVLRREIGLSETDKPDDEELKRRIILRVIDRSPALAPALLPALGIEVDMTAVDTQPFPQTPTETTPERQIGGPPDTPPNPSGGSGGVSASADIRLSVDALAAACDGLVHRALERAGQRLRNKAGRGAGGPAGIDCGDAAELHTQFDVSTFSNVHELLDGAWTRVPTISDRYGVPTEELLIALDSYTRGLLVSGQPHDIGRLRDALPTHTAVKAGAT
jgi:hypothetical protein